MTQESDHEYHVEHGYYPRVCDLCAQLPNQGRPTIAPARSPHTVHQSLTIHVAQTAPKVHSRPANGTITLSLTGDDDPNWLYLNGTESELIDFAWVILATLTMQRGKAEVGS